MSVTDALIHAGVPDEDISRLESQIETTVRTVFSDYDVELTSPNEVIVGIQTALFEKVIEFGEAFEDSTVSSQFSDLQGDFEDPLSQTARYNIIFITGSLTMNSDSLSEFIQLSEELMRENYQSVE